jgi:hypothetical protein
MIEEIPRFTTITLRADLHKKKKTPLFGCLYWLGLAGFCCTQELPEICFLCPCNY